MNNQESKVDTPHIGRNGCQWRCFAERAAAVRLRETTIPLLAGAHQNVLSPMWQRNSRRKQVLF